MSPLRRRPVATAPTKAPEANGQQPEVADLGALLGDILVRRNAVSHSQVGEALVAQQARPGKSVGELLVEMGALDERDLAEALSEQLEIPFVDLRLVVPEALALALLPEAVARGSLAVPLRVTDDALDVAVADPSPEVRKTLAAAAGRAVHLSIAPPSDIRRTIDSTYRVLGGVERLVQAFEAHEGSRSKADTPQQVAVADDAPVVQVVNLILTQALRDRASDVHIEPQDERLRIRLRIDGALHDALALPKAMAAALVSRLKIMADMNIVERRRSQDGQFNVEIDGRSLDVRVATTATIWGEKCVLRLLDKTRPLYKLQDLGMPEDTAEMFSKIVRSPFGMVICAGPTGSGKTTTLYATLTEINDSQRNMMTIEDPVEYVFPSVNQIQTNEQAGMTFATGLKAILRQDPDVILVGECRDVETARIAIQSALTGHFVLSSLHATDASAALHRFLDMGIESFLISSSILAVVGQRLVRRICTFCQVPYTPSDDEMAFYKEAANEKAADRKTKFVHGEGCNFCSDTGYQERIGVYELLRITPEIRRLVVGWATQEEIRRMAVSQGMRTLTQEAVSLVQQDVTTITEVIRSIYTM